MSYIIHSFWCGWTQSSANIFVWILTNENLCFFKVLFIDHKVRAGERDDRESFLQAGVDHLLIDRSHNGVRTRRFFIRVILCLLQCIRRLGLSMKGGPPCPQLGEGVPQQFGEPCDWRAGVGSVKRHTRGGNSIGHIWDMVAVGLQR